MTDPTIKNFLETSAAVAMKDSPCLHEWLGVSTGIWICKICECELSGTAYNILKELETNG